MAGVVQQAAQSIAKHRAPRVAHVQRAGRVGRNIFDVHLGALPHGRAAIVGAIVQNSFDQPLPDGGIQTQVQKPWPRHFGHRDAGIISQLGGQRLGNVARFHLGWLGQHHRRIGRHVAMGSITRRFDRYVLEIQPLGQRALGHHGVQRLDHQRTKIGE